MKPIFYILVLSFFFLTPQLKAQVIPPERRVDWTLAGLQKEIPEYSNVVDITTFGGNGNGITPNDAPLAAAIASLGTDSGVIYFPAGTYSFLSNITLRSGLVMRGDGAASTTFRFNLGGVEDCITFPGTP